MPSEVQDGDSHSMCNPIRTRNYLVAFWQCCRVRVSHELLLPEDWPEPEYRSGARVRGLPVVRVA